MKLGCIVPYVAVCILASLSNSAFSIRLNASSAPNHGNRTLRAKAPSSSGRGLETSVDNRAVVFKEKAQQGEASKLPNGPGWGVPPLPNRGEPPTGPVHKEEEEDDSTLTHLNHMPMNAEHLDEKEVAFYLVVPVAVTFMVVILLINFFEKIEVGGWLPESLIVIFVGMLLSFGLKTTPVGQMRFFQDEHVFAHVCGTVLNLVLLPLVIFESGWSLRTKDFASQFGYILVFAVAGSMISFLCVGLLILHTGQWGLHVIRWPRTAFAFASLISATDPVATLATYSTLKVDPLLNILVWGDSMFNDVVAIILFKTLNDDLFMGTKDSRPSMYELGKNMTYGICWNLGGSVVIGVSLAMVFVIFMRFTTHHVHDLEVLYLLFASYMAFSVAEVCGLSGIIATMFCSIIMGIYARPILTPSGSLLANYFIKQVARLMDMSIFLLIGISAVWISNVSFKFALCIMVFCLVSRAVSVFPCGFFVNQVKKSRGKMSGLPEEQWNLISPKVMFMMWHAGLRGAIALALCMQLGGWVDKLEGDGTRSVLQTATFSVIVVFLLVFGGTTEPCLKALTIPMGQNSAPDKLWAAESSNRARSMMATVHKEFMVPLLVGDMKRAEAISEDLAAIDIQDRLSFDATPDDRKHAGAH